MVGIMAMRTWIEPVVAGSQVASAFYDTALLLVVKNYYNQTNSTAPSHILEDAQQKVVSNFYIIYNLVLGLSPLVSAYGLSKLGDRIHRKIPICFPLLGYLGSKTLLLLLILLGWPVEVMYGAAAVNGLTGGFTTLWAGIMALGSLRSSESKRSLRLIVIELVYGLAGFLGSMASGYLFVGFSDRYREGTVLVCCSIVCYAFCLLYSIFVLTVPKPASCPAKAKSAEEVGGQLPEAVVGGSSQPSESSISTPVSPSKLIIILLFVAAILYDLAVVGAMNVLPLFLLREPLSWNAVEIGHGNAAGYVIFITSFLGVLVFSRYLRDITMIMIGVASFSAGILIMAFVKWTFLFYIARAVMLFALIPLPTIRSMLSKHVEGSSYGKVFVLLQLSLVTTGVVTSTVYNKIYQNTLDWYSGFCFILSFLVGCLSLLPLSFVAIKQWSTTGSLEILTE
ncbi:Thymic stromal cotransporter [Lonchura striata]|uniref:Thymic stromal cotransporter n=1 Tax=Lonchura striata TaxID=40157 RepID=A0A218UUT1_9PASE|nr:thymic stromal cotransporter homolog [Lonchura striata domestica]OWK57281.1 Thymic stromal cotransporter [Lonchura striata domestica]